MFVCRLGVRRPEGKGLGGGVSVRLQLSEFVEMLFFPSIKPCTVPQKECQAWSLKQLVPHLSSSSPVGPLRG